MILLNPFLYLRGESREERKARERAEAEAQRVSDAIDEQLRQEHVALRLKQKPVKVLLLGQSESGKSTLLKSFLLQFAPHEWTEERMAWRVVIFLNLVCSVNHVLDVLSREMSQSDSDSNSPSIEYTWDSDLKPSSHVHVCRFTDKHRLLKLRLAPLRTVQADLEERLGLGSPGVDTTTPTVPTGQAQKGRVHSRFGITPRKSWEEANNEIMDILVGCREDMKDLWKDAVVQQILTCQTTRIEDSPSFFLNDIERIAASNYEPSDDDIIRARLRTVGIQEHKFVVMEGGQGTEWVMYDVGGITPFRAAWASFFDDVDVTIFLSPLSCFDETLPGDPSVNRLENSCQLWRSICSSPMLAKTQIILLLNKCDLLRKKLEQGIHVKDFIPSFEDRKNDTFTVMKYFESHFREISKSVSPEPRQLYVYTISIIDQKTVAVTRLAVQESILRTHLRKADLV